MTGLEQASAPTAGGFPARLAASAADRSSNSGSSAFSDTPMHPMMALVAGSGGATTRARDESSAFGGGGGDVSTNNDAAKRLKLDPYALTGLGGGSSSGGGVLNDGRGNVGHASATAMAHMTGASTAGVAYNPTAMLSSANAAHMYSNVVPPQQHQQHQSPSLASAGAGASPLDINLFMQSLPPGYALPPAMVVAAQNAGSSQAPARAAAAAAPVAVVDETCFICSEKGGVFTCKAGCGLHVHPACIGEELLFPSSVGLLCGSCFVMQQNRTSKENLQQGGTAGLSVRRAVLFLNLETNSQANFDKFGHMASLRLVEIGEIAGYPIKPFAAKFVEPYLQRWIREKLGHADKSPLNVREIFTFLVGLFGLKQACIAHGLKDKVVELVKARKLSATDFLGWHPSIDSPHVQCSSLCQGCGVRNAPEASLAVKVCTQCARPLMFPSVFTKFASALLATYYAEQVGISLGTTCLDVFAHTNTVRASYKGLKPYDADGTEWDMFAEQLRTIFGVLDVVSNFGVLQLNPDLFEPELKIIRNASYLNHAMLLMEYEVVAKFLQSMRLFGPSMTAACSSLIAVCEHFLFVKQLQNGSWCKVNGSAPEQYKATATCAKALAKPVFQGCGPVSSEFYRLLEKWAKAAPNSKYVDVPNVKVLVSGAKAKPPVRTSMKQLETLYRRQMVPESGVNPLERFVTERLRQILPSKKPEVAQDDDASAKTDADAASGSTDSEDIKTEQPGTDEHVRMDREAATNGDGDAAAAAAATDSGGERAHARADDDDALTSMSLNEDLEIFDGLKFEGGDVIDVASRTRSSLPSASAEQQMQQMQTQGLTSDDGDDDANDTDAVEGDVDVDTDGAETERPDDDDEEMADMYDDDDDENDNDGSGDLPEIDASVPVGTADDAMRLDAPVAFDATSSGDFSLDT